MTRIVSLSTGLIALLAIASIAVGSAFTASPNAFLQKSRVASSSSLDMGFMDEVGNFMKRFTMKASASHILIKGGAKADNKLEDLKAEIGNDPVKFAEAAATYSACPSGRKGGNLGEFGPGQMVREFDKVVFNDEVGMVHGPIRTQFGSHLILITDRTE